MSQADYAPITGERTFVGGNSALPTRRAMLGTLMAIPAAIAPITALATPIAAPAQSALDQKIAAFKRSDAAWDHFLTETFNPAVTAHEDALARIPHVTIPYEEKGRVLEFSTAVPQHVRNARRWLKGTWEPEQDDYGRVLRRLVQADDAIQAQKEKLKANMDAVSARDDVMCKENDRLFKAVMSHPAEGMADLFAKLQLVREMGRWDWDEVAGAFIADVDRLSIGGLSIQ